MMASELGMSIAAPMPCTARAAINWATVGEIPHHTDPSAKMPAPITKTRRRPNRSPAAPPINIREATQSV